MKKGRAMERFQSTWMFGLIAAVGFLLLYATGAVAGGKIESYTATQVHMDPGGAVTGESVYYVTPERMRMQGMPGGQMGGADIAVIVLQDQKKYIMLNDKEKIYFEKPLEEGDLDGSMMQSLKDNTHEKVLGNETVNGYECVKKQVETSMEVMGYKHTNTTTVWITDAIDLPMRTRTEDGNVSEIRTIKKGKPDSSFFTVPGDYRRAASMFEMMAAGMDREETGAKGGSGNPFMKGGSMEGVDIQEMMKKFKQPQ